MTAWGLAACLYGVTLSVAASTQPIRRRSVAFAASLAYALAGFGVGTLVDHFWANLLAPGALLLIGYWLCGFYFRDPQAWLESWLLRIDRACRAERWMAAVPRPVAELLELSYALDYAVVGGGAIYAATFGIEAVSSYWTLVLSAELASFAPLPWLRSRPPRAIEPDGGHGRASRPRGHGLASRPGGHGLASRPGGHGFSRADVTRHPDMARLTSHPSTAPAGASRVPRMRALNTVILDNASVQANTLPSGHVSGAVAAALAIWTFDPVVGAGLMVMAGVIAIAAIAGRYHYVVDCVAGAAVAAAFSSLM